ncbi:hypothetical protein PCLA_10r0326 [Pseudomonas citronellolis]|nr:hypothetical protein PCLA_10r0326 [Pseudomonas citronellolis]
MLLASASHGLAAGCRRPSEISPAVGRTAGHWIIRRVFSSGKANCTNQLVLCSISEQKADQRIDGFSSSGRPWIHRDTPGPCLPWPARRLAL